MHIKKNGTLLPHFFINIFIEACSAGAVEISYWSHPYYEIEVQFMSETEWAVEQVLTSLFLKHIILKTKNKI